MQYFLYRGLLYATGVNDQSADIVRIVKVTWHMILKLSKKSKFMKILIS